MYKLYGSPKSRAGRVMWMLEELGADYEVIDAGPHSPAVYALNPSGKIPILVDGDVVVTDSTAIMLHLADKHGAMTYPAGSAERAKMTSLVSFAVDEVEQPLWTGTKHGFILPEALRCAEAITPALHHEFKVAMTTLDKRLGGGPFVMGEEFTVPDVILGHLGGWAKMTGFPAPPERVAEYMKRIRARPAWRAVVEARKGA